MLSALPIDISKRVIGAQKALLAVILSCSPWICNATSLDTNFVSLLNGDAQIRYFRVGFPGDLFILNGKPVDGEVYYEGSIQKNTFWVRNCTNSPPLSGHILPGWFIGMSYKDYWTYRDDATAISPKDSKTPSALDGRAQQVYAWVYKGLGIGIEIKPGSFHVQPDNNFEAEDLNTGDKISGHFDVAANGFPTRCTYTEASVSDGKAIASFDYPQLERSSKMPSRLTTTIFKGPTKMGGSEYQILDCDFGSVPLPREGYTVGFMTNFGKINFKMQEIAGITVFRDGLMYKQDRKGNLTLVRKTPLAENSQRMSTRRTTIIVLISILAILPLWLIARSEAANKPKKRTAPVN